MFVLPLLISTCLIALSHGCNEINVALPTSAMIFLLDNSIEDFNSDYAFAGIGIGFVSIVFGFMTLGKRHLNKVRYSFQRISLQK